MRDAVVFSAGVALGGALTYWLSRRAGRPDVAKLRRLRSQERPLDSESGVYFNSADAPAWLRGLFWEPSQRRVLMREWEDAEWRARAGWMGTDLIHDPAGRGVQVLAYFWHAESQTLTGIARFGPAAESHRGLCHGGAMTSLMDDLCGHICFVLCASPWSGATVQVNCKLMKPVKVGDVLKVVGKVDRQERSDAKKLTKVWVSAELVGEDGAVYAKLEGLSVTPVPMSDVNDAVAQRTWIGKEGGALCDSGWAPECSLGL